MSAGATVERVATLDPAMLAHCDFSFDPEGGAYPFDGAFAVPGPGRMIGVARVDGRVAGYIACLSDDESTEVRRIEIDRGYRGQGLGRRLLDEARDRACATSLSALRLETLPDNPRAGRFFARYGFILTGQADTLYWRMPL